MSPYYDRKGNAITAELWDELYQLNGYRRVSADVFGPLVVSTVWLGVNHSLDRDAPPLIFETCVLRGSITPLYCARYSTLRAAMAGHQEAVRLVESGELS